ncbi:efflux RND transporter periplasmic adaptor subunit [Temperatibacter marinus]|uniref:Efflux RND transporter periplasmic adaptor subunit n=1 Tax=Temperatibacter marinus TaxID=1456591 RepID=A0AA52EFY7_9PROT|nr:efflux RND transporter periplasmic adaptor subunit [Temperatibacter marinus]WND04066.1 efflux RND transporter periplasmic adaptor subunit [Temperatibacter marinus]
MKKFIIVIAIITVVVIMAVFSKKSSSEGQEMMIEKVERGRVAASVLASGTLNFREIINLRTEVTGKISEIHVEEGAVVKKGNTLLVISAEQFEADLKRQEAMVSMRRIAIERQEVFSEQLKRSLRRQKDLFETGHIGSDAMENYERDYKLSRLDLDSRRKDLEQAEALLAQANDRLNKTVIRAPIDGIVTTSNAKIGETVVAGTTNIIGSALLDVADPSAVLAEVQVAETDILSVKIGQKALVTTVAAPENPMAGEVISIGTTARRDSNQQNSFLVKILIKSDSGDFSRLAISCRAEIYTEVAESAVFAPVEAVLNAKKDGQTTQHVFVAVEGKVVKRTVEIGIQTDSKVEIVSGLKENDDLIVGPYRKLRTLRENSLVKPRNVNKEDDNA